MRDCSIWEIASRQTWKGWGTWSLDFIPDGRPCPCGNSGCLEQYASSKAVYEEFARLKGLDYVNSDILTDYVKKGDTDATALLKKNAALLSIGINNINHDV